MNLSHFLKIVILAKFECRKEDFMDTQTVLFVDDEINILRSLERGLIDEDFECIFANSAKQALDILEKEPISVIVSDMRMPEMDGLQLLKIVKEKWPKTVRIVLSGYAQLTQVLATVNQADIFRFILKPWKMDGEFMDILNSALEYNKLQLERDFFEESLKKQNKAYVNIMKQMEETSLKTKQDFARRDSILDTAFDTMLEYFDKDTTVIKNQKRMKAAYYILRSLSKVSFDDITEKSFSLFWKEVQQKVASHRKSNANVTESNLTGKGKTNYNLIYELIDIILTLLDSKSPYQSVNVVCDKELYQGQIILSLIMYIPTIISQNADMKDYVISNIEIIDPLLNQIMGILNGNFKCILIESNAVATFKIPIIDLK